ncbi:helix-turn-helix domain-containing protein [Paraburkholderia sp. 40]
MNITLDELATFMAVVDTGSMTAAAQYLDLNWPAQGFDAA